MKQSVVDGLQYIMSTTTHATPLLTPSPTSKDKICLAKAIFVVIILCSVMYTPYNNLRHLDNGILKILPNEKNPSTRT